MIKQKILSFLAKYPRQVFKAGELAHRLSLKTEEEHALLRQALKELEEADQIQHARHGKFGHLEMPQTVKGTLQLTKQGFGFVTAEGMDQDIFIAPRSLGTAAHGDRVEVSLFAPSQKQKEKERKRPEGEVVRVLERGRSTIVGTLERQRKTFFVTPDDRRFATEIIVEDDELMGAREGDKVVIQIDSWGTARLTPVGRVLEVLGRAGDSHAELLSVAREFQLPLKFPHEVEEAAERIPVEIPATEYQRRLDFRQQLCFTIDPEDAKDFDDAISLEPLPDGNERLGVHIADVSFYVREGDVIDAEAFKRGTSVYFPNMVIPMLPEKLSNIVCSLRPREDRLTYSVFMTVTPKGTVKEYEIRESVINSKHRFAYEQIDEILEGTSQHGIEENMLQTIRRMHTLSTLLTRKRMGEGSIDFESAEAKFRFDQEGKPTEIIKKARRASHRLVEEFMLLANKVVATHVGLARKEEHAKPFLYRIHDSPDPERLRELAAFVEKLGFKWKADGGISSKVLQRLLDQVRGTEVENVVNEVALRSMAKAVYSERNIGHFGLAFDYYSHFTSPIRRYPDLVIHRLLKEYERGTSLERRQELLKKLPPIAKHSSERERIAMEAERASIKVMQVEYMKRHLGDEFEGVISGVTHYGMFVEINNLLVEGMIHVRDLDDDYYMYDEKKYALIGRRGGRQYRLGDKIRVKVLRVNPEEREIDFHIVDESPPQDRPHRVAKSRRN